MTDRVVYKTRAPATHCRKGHAMEGDNVILVKSGYRRCRECLRKTRREWAKRNYRRRRLAKEAK